MTLRGLPWVDPRPSWDVYFLKIAEQVATRSTCLRRAVGAVTAESHWVRIAWAASSLAMTKAMIGSPEAASCSGVAR